MQEWFEFQQSARSAVREREKIEFKRGFSTKRLFQIVKFPSFSSSVGWEVLRERDLKSKSDRFLGVRREWMFGEDIKKFETPVARLGYPKVVPPSILMTRFELSHELANRTMAGFEPLSVPVLFREATVGVDGTSWLFVSGDEWAGLELSWWEYLPGEWASTSKKIQTLFYELEQLHSR